MPSLLTSPPLDKFQPVLLLVTQPLALSGWHLSISPLEVGLGRAYSKNLLMPQLSFIVVLSCYVRHDCRN